MKKKSRGKKPEQNLLVSIRGQRFTAEEVGQALANQFQGRALVHAMRRVVQQGKGNEMRVVLDVLTLQETDTAFRDGNEAQLGILEQICQEYPLSMYLDGMGIPLDKATKNDVQNWWDLFMAACADAGYVPNGRINDQARTNNLWNATGKFSDKMDEDPAKYEFLPGHTINNAELVARTLGRVREPWPYVEILTGEDESDLRRFPQLVGAFSTFRRDDQISRTLSDSIFSMGMVIKRSIIS